MVKGNKFKPKAPPQLEQAVAAPAARQPATDSTPPANAPTGMIEATAAAEVSAKMRDKKAKKRLGVERMKGKSGSGETAIPEGGPQSTAVVAAGGQGDQGVKLPVKKQKLSGNKATAGVTGTPPPVPIVPTLVVPVPPKSATAAGVGSNWAALKSVMAAQQQQQLRKPGTGKRGKLRGRGFDGGDEDPTQDAKRRGKMPQGLGSDQGLTKVLAIDCEMVGVGSDGSRSALARVCIVNSAGNVLLDTYVKPKEPVTDYRTTVSGVRPSHLVGAPDFDSVQVRVEDALRGRVVVGHAITNDLQALMLGHPRKDIRDTSRYPPLMQGGGKARPRALRHIAEEELGLVIQSGEHNPVDDARAALYLYLKFRKEWERWLAKGGKRPRQAPHHQHRNHHQHQQPSGAVADNSNPLWPHHSHTPSASKMLKSLELLAKKADYLSDL